LNIELKGRSNSTNSQLSIVTINNRQSSHTGINKMKNQEKVFLIVDDEPDMCWALENILKRKGLCSKKALNGREALEFVKQNHFWMVFLDAKLPDMEGLQLAKKIRDFDPLVRIVIVSGYFYRDDTDILNAQKEGSINDFIAKPFSHNEVMKVIEGL
jgi:DNA-binding NtrC family response regulator